MKHLRISRAFALAALGALVFVAGGCTDDDDPVGPENLDGRIVAVAIAINAGEIFISETADGRAESAAVLQFAEMMIEDHNASNEAIADLGIDAVPNSLSIDFSQTATEIRTSLLPLSGHEYDVAYIDAQVSLHESALATIEDTLIPESEDAGLIAVLEQMRETIRSHLQVAEDLAVELEA